jgi:hypothetical protein
MKKILIVMVSLVLALSFVLAAPAQVQAKPMSPQSFDWTPPVVTPLYGDKIFSAISTPVLNLPGTIPNGDNLTLPVGFPKGTAQFGGDALVVKDMLQGSMARVCFSMPPERTQWVGTVHQWNGSKWVRLATTVSQAGDEATVATACTQIYGDGIYALIMGYTGLPEPKMPVFD